MLISSLSFYKNKKVLVTGHTGFKGSWLCEILVMAGAEVIGYSLEPHTNPNLFNLLKLETRMTSIIGDIRNYESLNYVFDKYQPEIVFHLAAQPIVRESYERPLYTYDVNVMGTVNVCECVRTHDCVKSFLNVTTDKVYQNDDIPNHRFKEDEKLDGFDPYSNSKSCSDIITHSYYKSFLKKQNVAVSTARAGNVIGGGDFSRDRIIPDAVKALSSGKELVIRHPHSTRPYQHVLEPLLCYLLIAKKQFRNPCFCSSYNIGPDKEDCLTTKDLIQIFSKYADNLTFRVESDNGPHEASFLSLDNDKMKRTFLWKPKVCIEEAIRLTAEWYLAWIAGKDIRTITDDQILEYFLNAQFDCE